MLKNKQENITIDGSLTVIPTFAVIKYKFFSCFDLIFPRHGDKLSVEFTPQPAKPGFQAHLQSYSAKEHVNPPSFPVTLLLLGEIPAHGSTVSSCLRVLLGVSLRPSSGLLEEPTCSRMGSVRLFCARMSPNCLHLLSFCFFQNRNLERCFHHGLHRFQRRIQ